jgi:ribosome-associated toxin RatA of RatAB toxin-antitoxin module
VRSVKMRLAIAEMTADEVFERIAAFPEYPRHTDAVREVEILEAGEQHSRSSWEINFRDGIMRWKEEDRFFPDARRIEFHAVDGDLDSFEGQWSVEDGANGTTLTFSAEFDLGLQTLNEMVEPIAEEALRESIVRIVEGLTDGRAEAVEGEPAATGSKT